VLEWHAGLCMSPRTDTSLDLFDPHAWLCAAMHGDVMCILLVT
jgi:hypothetical protein